jgi:hypothetical protein
MVPLLGPSLGGFVCIRLGTDLLWWEKMLLSFIITFVISIILNMIRGKGNKVINVNKVNDRYDRCFKDIQGIMYNKDKKIIQNMKYIMNNKYIKILKNRMDKVLKLIIFK